MITMNKILAAAILLPLSLLYCLYFLGNNVAFFFTRAYKESADEPTGYTSLN